jgi:hypothetical protein
MDEIATNRVASPGQGQDDNPWNRETPYDYSTMWLGTPHSSRPTCPVAPRSTIFMTARLPRLAGAGIGPAVVAPAKIFF